MLISDWSSDVFSSDLLLLFYLLYALAFLFLTLGVSAVARTAKGALIALIGFWAMATFILPKAAADISKMVTPTPTYSEFYHLARQTSLVGMKGAKGLLALPQGRSEEGRVGKECVSTGR